MITFLVCLALLVTAYFTYGRYLERLVGIDPAARTPCSRLYDGVDYVPLPRWRIFLIQLLNIAGLGPIFGAVLGAAYGPVAFLWITFGGIFMGAAHDFIAGVISLRHDGASLPETAGVYLGGGMKIVMRLFSAGLMILVGAVFLSQPASLVAARLDVPSLEGIAFGGFSWLLLIVLGVCLDTCHIWDGGYDIVGNLDGVLEEFDRTVGLNRLKAIHLNDSKNPRSSHKDRHEKIGEGEIGLDALVSVINHPALKHLPFYLETPNELPGYAHEIKLLREHYVE